MGGLLSLFSPLKHNRVKKSIRKARLGRESGRPDEGKGVATSLGVVCGLAPLAFLVGILFWLLSYYVIYRGVVSFASMLAVLMMAVSSLVFKLTIIKDISWVTISLLFFLAVIVIVRHRENIKRILEGTESSFVKINKK